MQDQEQRSQPQQNNDHRQDMDVIDEDKDKIEEIEETDRVTTKVDVNQAWNQMQFYDEED